MITSWTAGLDAERKKEVIADFKSSIGLRMRLKEILEKKVNTRREAVLATSQYDSPSWAYLQADNNGYERALNEVISLIFEKEVEK